MNWLARQVLDFLGYLFLPFICFLLPLSLASRLINWVSRRSFVYRVETFRAFENANAVQEINDPVAWKSIFRLTRFVDSVDVWHGLFSSDRRLEQSLVVDPERWPDVEKVVLLGTHLGPGSLLLRRLASAGFQPRFVYRDVPVEMRRARPVYYLYLKLRIRFVQKACQGGAIRVPGGREEVARAMAQSGSALILLVDAPASGGSQTMMNFKNSQLPISTKGLEMACSQKAVGAFFSIRWDDSKNRRIIEMGQERMLEDCADLIRECEEFVRRTINQNPAQWQLWLTAQAVLKPLP